MLDKWGSDSDLMLDMLYRLDPPKKIVYIWLDTGLEYEATKRHLKEIEEKYGISVIPLKAKKAIPAVVKEYGVPFISKQVSEFTSRLQRHNFQWEDESYEVLSARYPKCLSALRWWCNVHEGNSKFNISIVNPWLKEFIIQNPPDFKISNKCCHYAKKTVAHDFMKNSDYDLECVGVRKLEGGARSSAYKSCFTPHSDSKIAQYRPLYWFSNQSKQIYKDACNITYSDCYEIWGMKRTGCAACPFGREFEFELECIQKYEPKLYKAVNNIFGKSYEYTRKYRQFQKEMSNKKKKSAINEKELNK